MSAKTVLILAPTLVSLFLAQSYFWVPSFSDQVRGDPGRLTRYIESSIGDASILNPTLSADSASSEIAGLVFDGLIDRDMDLSYRGRLAESWRIFEEAYLLVDETQRLPDGGPVTAEALRRRLEAALAAGQPSLAAVERIEVEPGRELSERVEVKPADKGGPAKTVQLALRRPPRLKFTLREVDQDFFAKLDRLLDGYVGRIRPTRWLNPGLEPPLRERALELLAATEHNPVIMFQLRKGVRFHDGQEFDSRDVRFTYETIMDPRNLSPRVPDFEPIKSVETPGRHTVRVTYKRLFQPGFESWGMGMLPEHRLNPEALRAEARALGRDPDRFTARDSNFSRHPIGTGPFRFVEWRTDQYIRLARYDGHWDGPPNFREFLYRIIPDPLTTELTFYAGTTDEYAAQPHQVERLRDDPRFMQFSGLALGYTYIGYNMRRAPFQDERVRTALAMAINTQEIISYVLYGQAEPITGPFPKQTDFYDPTVRPLPHDPAGALRLLEEAGYRKNGEGWLEKDGKPLAFTLITNSGNEIRKAVMAIAQNAWRRLGIKVETLALEWAVFINERVNKADFDALVLGWSMGLDADIYQIFHSSQMGPFQLNFVGYRNPAADDLMVRIRQEYNRERQVAMARELHRLIAKDQPYTFLFVGKWTALYDRKITRQVRAPDGSLRYAAIVPTKLGSPKFHFNQWIKVPQPVGGPVHAAR
ncbi:MAG: peptide ABC transporter substrate-binding protein [candidate division NC10 bacterium]|nr:peptide ABC transporter substrate-binding protein [candidate division NC10 bacterium]